MEVRTSKIRRGELDHAAEELHEVGTGVSLASGVNRAEFRLREGLLHHEDAGSEWS